MKKCSKIELQNRYLHPLFFQSTELELPYKSESLFPPYFNPDLQATYHGGEPPWRHFDKWLSILLHDWNRTQSELLTLFEKRSNTSKPFMLKGISIFFMMLFWSNDKNVELKNWHRTIDDMPITCINLEERLSFILKRPDSYYSYVQLDLLIRELHKAIAKHNIRRKNALS